MTTISPNVLLVTLLGLGAFDLIWINFELGPAALVARGSDAASASPATPMTSSAGLGASFLHEGAGDDTEGGATGDSVGKHTFGGQSPRFDVVGGEPVAAAIPTVSTATPSLPIVRFRLGRDEVALAPQLIRQIREAIATRSDINLVVRGHADATGSAKVNRALAGRRARNVERQLVAAGIPEDRMRAVNLGESEPLSRRSNDPQARRVDFRWEIRK